MHIPPKHKHPGNPSDCLYYGQYSSRTKGKANEDGSLAKFAYRHGTSGDVQPEQPSDDYTETVSSKSSRQSWARLIQKVYEVDPLICLKCSHKMRIVAIINEPGECKHSLEVNKILECLKRNHAPPFDKVVTKAS